MKKTALLTILSLSVVFSVCSQSFSKRQEFSVMNPNTHEMAKFGLTPVNQYTGKANVSFPLFSLNLDGKEIPFVLSYDTGGIKVSQEASWVGLGWNLSGIPTISHLINQRSDIGNKPPSHLRGYCYEPKLPSSVNGVPDSAEEVAYLNLANQNHNVPYNELDSQPDIFVANLIGSTVKFQLTQQADTGTIQALILNDSNAEITYYDIDQSSNFVQHFDVVDEDGYKYEFRHVEYTTSWSQPGSLLDGEIDPEDIRGYWHNGTNYNTAADNFIPTAWYVDKIISPDGDSLDFIYDYELDGAPNISVSHPLYHGARKITTCGYAINNGVVTNGWEAGFFDDVTATRSIQENMVLSEVVHSSTGNRAIFTTASREDLYPWEAVPLNYLEGFSYYNAITVDAIPKKLTEIEVKSGLGKSIKTISFQQSYFNNYKLGDSDEKSYLRLKLDGFSYHDQQYAFKYQCDDALPAKHSKSTDFWGFYNGVENVQRTPSVRLDGSACTLENPDLVNMDGEFVGATKGSSYESGLVGTLVEVRYPTGGTTTFEYEGNTATLDLSDPTLTPDDFNYPYLLNHNIEPGFPKTGVLNSNYKIFPVGGLRIKSVTNNDASGNPLLRKSYRYDVVKPNGDQVSSGLLMNPLHHFRSVVESGDGSLNVIHSNLVITSANVFNISNSAMGSHLGYGHVEEVFDNINGNVDIGKITTIFINKPNESLADGDNETKFLVETPPINYEDANGKVLTQEIFHQDGSLKQSLVNTYQYPEQYFQTGYKIFYSSLTQTISLLGLGTLTQRYISDYYHFSPKKYLALADTNTTTTVLDGGNVITTSSNQYNSLHRLRSTEVSTSDSAIKKRTELFYPYDTDYGVNDFLVARDLTSLNQINQPLYRRFYENNDFLGHELTRYFIFPGSLTKPESIHYSKEDSNLESIEMRVKYERYDSYGNLVQYKQADGVDIAAIWGYNGQNIVAQIENATYADIESLTGFGSGFDLGNSGLSAGQKNTLRTDPSLSEAMVTIYDHDPLIGPTSMEDTRSYETTYEYDNFNRLVAIRDAQDNLLEDFKYAYANVQLYPQNGVSECFDDLVIEGISTSDLTVGNVNMTVQVSGGVGNYQYEWFLGEGPSLQEADFQTNPVNSIGSYNWIICCDTRKYMRVVVTSGAQTETIEFSNQDFQTNCPTNPCDGQNF